MPALRSHVVDVETIYREDQSDFSDDDSVISWDELRARREFRLHKEDGQKPVYEAWQIRLPVQEDTEATNIKTTTSWKVLGATVATKASTRVQGSEYYLNRPVDAEQPELADMHLRALEQYQIAHRRGWASRILRGKPKTYEEDLDDRCHKLPLVIQEVINNLLDQRGKESSTKYRDRKWTVVVMQEQGFRFSKTERGPLTSEKSRFWKKTIPPPHGKVTYLVIIRGVETKVCEDAGGFTEFSQRATPWLEVDREECRRKARESRLRRAEERRKRRCASPSFYPDWRDWPPSSDSDSDGRRSPSPPSYRTRRNYSPASEPNEERARRYIRNTRNAPPRVPTAPPPMPSGPAFTPSWAFPPVFDEHVNGYMSRMPPPPPAHPSPRFDESLFPPRAFEHDLASSVWDEPTPVPGPFRECFPASSPSPLPPTPRPIVTVDSSYSFRSATPALSNCDDNRPRTLSTAPRPRSECDGCQATVECDHFTKPICDRPLRVQRVHGTPHFSHPPCFICMAKGSDVDFAPAAAAFTGNRAQQSATPTFETHGMAAAPEPNSARPAGPTPVWPPPYSPGEHWPGDVFDDGDAATDIESGDDSDAEATAVADSPQPNLKE